jgi:hypothetical protein
MLSQEFIETLERMNIRVYRLITGDQIIGQLLEAHESAIELKNVLEIKSINLDGEIVMVMLPYVPFGATESGIVYRSSIIFESAASVVLKKKYCDGLLISKLKGLIDNHGTSSDELDNLEADEGDIGFDWTNLKQQYPNRNWNN